jgi:acyl carrier protein
MSEWNARREAIRIQLGSILADRLNLVGIDPPGDETRFFADLGLASIDAVVLGEALQACYGRSLPFGELMAGMGRRDQRDFSMGDLIAFLDRHLPV